jgi:predicted transcriptional regulator
VKNAGMANTVARRSAAAMDRHREQSGPTSIARSMCFQAGSSAAPLEQPTLDYLVDPRRAITELGVVCLECGQPFVI